MPERYLEIKRELLARGYGPREAKRLAAIIYYRTKKPGEPPIRPERKRKERRSKR